MHRENGLPQSHSRSGFGFYLLMTIIIIGCLMGLCYFAMLKVWYGELGVTEDEIRGPALWANGLHVVLVDSRCPGDSPAGEMKAWQQLLGSSGIPFETVGGTRWDSSMGSGVLVLPSAECLNESGKDSIRAWLRRGGGVLATGLLGLRDASGRSQGGGFLQEIAGVEAREIRGVDTPVYFTLAARSPLALGLGPSERWKVPAGTWAVGASSLFDAYWADSKWEPLNGTPRHDMVAITHRATNQGRVVWIGASLDAVGQAESNRSTWDRLFLNSVYWTGRRPVVGVSIWPAGQNVAVVIAQEIHEAVQLPEALVMARTLREKHIPVTFFIRASLSHELGSLMGLAQLGEVAVLGEATSTNEGSKSENVFKQRERLELPLQRPIQGISLPNGAPQSTLSDLVQAGYSYYLDNVSLVSAAPVASRFSESFLFPLDTRILVGLPAVGKDDFAVLTEYMGPAYSVEGIAEQLWQDFQKSRWLGGLHVLNYRTDLLGSPLVRPALLHFLEHLDTQDTWLTSASEVAHWWRQREQIGVEVTKLSPRRIRMGLWNEGREDVEEVVVFIALPYVPSNLYVTASLGGGGVTYQILKELGLLRMQVSRLKAQSKQTWAIDLK